MKTDQTNQIIRQVVAFWESNNKNITAFFNKHPDEVYSKYVAPGRNSGVYIFGHLITLSDTMFPMFGLGEKMYPELSIFSGASEDTVEHSFTVAQLREKWNNLNEKLGELITDKTPEWWLDRHLNVSEADFALDSTRNKLNVLMGRASHANYHRGQLVFLIERKPLN